jgi:hypothetical protein
MTQPILHSIMLDVESDAFSAQANLASGWTIFRAALLENATTTRLSSILRDSPKNVETIVNRVQALVNAQIDHRYANPYDVALAAYLWSLSAVDPGTARIAAEIVLGARQTWWARETASALLATLVADAPRAMFQLSTAVTKATEVVVREGSVIIQPFIGHRWVVLWNTAVPVQLETVQSRLLFGLDSIRLSPYRWTVGGYGGSNSTNTSTLGAASISWRFESARSREESA